MTPHGLHNTLFDTIWTGTGTVHSQNVHSQMWHVSVSFRLLRGDPGPALPEARAGSKAASRETHIRAVLHLSSAERDKRHKLGKPQI